MTVASFFLDSRWLTNMLYKGKYIAILMQNP